ncbi:minor tail protein [Sesbania bispinosa]|nr:minor tail protein [Sesbania bispinosa]
MVTWCGGGEGSGSWHSVVVPRNRSVCGATSWQRKQFHDSVRDWEGRLSLKRVLEHGRKGTGKKKGDVTEGGVGLMA